MNRLNKFIKGSLIAIMLSMLLNVGLGFHLSTSSPLATPVAYAENGDEGGDGAEADSPCPDGEFGCVVGELPDSPEIQSSKNSEDIVDGTARLANKMHRLFAPWINYFAFQIGNFLGNDYIYQGAMGQMLHKIWIVSRNMVNIIFVFLLLWMAIKEIFFVGRESELRKNLIKFTLLLIAVNFSWLATKIVLDAANVATNVVFAIPSGVSGGATAAGLGSGGSVELPQCKVDTLGEQPITGACTPSAIFAPADSGTGRVFYFEDNDQPDNDCAKVKEAYDNAYHEDKTAKSDEELGDDLETDGKFRRRTTICMENLNFFEYNQNTAVIYLTYGMARIQNLVNANASTDAIQLSVGVLMSIIMQLAYALALTALFVALIVRMLMLWIFVGFSPFLILVMYFNDDPLADFDAGEFKFGWGEFGRWAFVPAKVGVIFAISFIMISAGQAVGSTFVDTLSNEGFTFKMLETRSVFLGLGSLQTFLWLLMSIAVLWLGVFAVLGKMSVIGGFAQSISRQSIDTAKLIAKSPIYAPVLPLKGGGKTSVRGALEPFRFTDDLREWERKARGGKGDVVKLEDTARKNLDGVEIKGYQQKLTEAQLKSVAKGLGYSDPHKLVIDHQESGVAAAITKAGNGGVAETRAKDIAKQLFDTYKPKAGRAEGVSAQAPAAAAAGGAAGGGAGQGESDVEKQRRRREARADTAAGTQAGIQAAGGAGAEPPKKDGGATPPPVNPAG